MGQDIAGACGQLALVNPSKNACSSDSSENEKLLDIADIEDVAHKKVGKNKVAASKISKVKTSNARESNTDTPNEEVQVLEHSKNRSLFYSFYFLPLLIFVAVTCFYLK